MGTDRELLERAAKAAGLEFKWREGDPKWGPEHVGPAAFHGGCWQAWNPLTDDGDALRLAVRLNLLAHPRVSHEIAVQRFTRNADKLTATRRAIVVAAAAMPEGGQG